MENDFTFEIVYVFMLLSLIVAVFGSVLTITSVIYAKRNQKHNFDSPSEWGKSTIFVLNVAFADIVYCIICFSHFLFALFLYLGYDVGDTTTGCQFFVLGTQNVACIYGWSIALTALSTAFPKFRYKNICTRLLR